MDYMRGQGVSETAIQADYVEHREFEIALPLEQQLTSLSHIGFTDVECFWKYLNLAVFGGRKG
jgi:Uri superfamily endonuclease